MSKKEFFVGLVMGLFIDLGVFTILFLLLIPVTAPLVVVHSASVSASAPLIDVPSASEKKDSIAKLYTDLKGWPPVDTIENLPLSQGSDEYEILRMIVEGDSGLKYYPPHVNVMNVSEAWRFMNWVNYDRTWQKKWKQYQYVCFNYSMDLIRNASQAGFKNLFLVSLYPYHDDGHCVVGFYVENVGLVLLEPNSSHCRLLNSEIRVAHNTTTLWVYDPKGIIYCGWGKSGGYCIGGESNVQLDIFNGNLSGQAGCSEF